METLEFFYHGKLWKLEDSVPWRLQQRPTTGNGDVIAKSGIIYISRTTTDMIEIPTANWSFRT